MLQVWKRSQPMVIEVLEDRHKIDHAEVVQLIEAGQGQEETQESLQISIHAILIEVTVGQMTGTEDRDLRSDLTWDRRIREAEEDPGKGSPAEVSNQDQEKGAQELIIHLSVPYVIRGIPLRRLIQGNVRRMQCCR